MDEDRVKEVFFKNLKHKPPLSINDALIGEAGYEILSKKSEEIANILSKYRQELITKKQEIN